MCNGFEARLIDVRIGYAVWLALKRLTESGGSPNRLSHFQM